MKQIQSRRPVFFDGIHSRMLQNSWIIYPWVSTAHDIQRIHPDDRQLVEKGIGIAYCAGRNSGWIQGESRRIFNGGEFEW